MTKITSYIEKMREIERAAFLTTYNSTNWDIREKAIKEFNTTARNELPKLLDALEIAMEALEREPPRLIEGGPTTTNFLHRVAELWVKQDKALAQIESILTKQTS